MEAVPIPAAKLAQLQVHNNKRSRGRSYSCLFGHLYGTKPNWEYGVKLIGRISFYWVLERVGRLKL